jgi:hypothetical protein
MGNKLMKQEYIPSLKNALDAFQSNIVYDGENKEDCKNAYIHFTLNNEKLEQTTQLKEFIRVKEQKQTRKVGCVHIVPMEIKFDKDNILYIEYTLHVEDFNYDVNDCFTKAEKILDKEEQCDETVEDFDPKNNYDENEENVEIEKEEKQENIPEQNDPIPNDRLLTGTIFANGQENELDDTCDTIEQEEFKYVHKVKKRLRKLDFIRESLKKALAKFVNSAGDVTSLQEDENMYDSKQYRKKEIFYKMRYDDTKLELENIMKLNL